MKKVDERNRGEERGREKGKRRENERGALEEDKLGSEYWLRNCTVRRRGEIM